MTDHNDKSDKNSLTRRQLLAGAAAAAAGATGFGGSLLRAASASTGPWGQPAVPASDEPSPNVIFILSDDHRWDHFGYLGHPFIQTPNLDKMAADGVTFSNAFVTTSLCSPSRACFLTGNWAHTHGVKNNITPWSNDNVTYLEKFKEAGYDTAFIGKWHMPGGLPQLRGVDRFITFTVQGGQGRYFDCPLIVDGKQEPSRVDYITEELTNRAIDFIDQKRQSPFCLFLAHKAAHHQFLPPPQERGIYDDVELGLPPEADPWISVTNGNIYYGTLLPLSVHYRNYCETLTALDREIGRLFDKLEEMGIADNTIVVYAGDNGFFWGEHHLVDKRWAYEESIRIPFIVRWPKKLAGGQKRDQMILNVDLAPTLMQLCRLQPQMATEGDSFAGVLDDPQAPWRTEWLYEYFRDYPYSVPGINALRTQSHIYIEYDDGRTPEFFNLGSDPRQMHNLVKTGAGQRQAREFKNRLAALMP